MSEDRYSQHARRALKWAQVYARHMGYRAIDTEHILLGILAEAPSLGAMVLLNLGLRLKTLELAVFGQYPSLETIIPGSRMPFSDDLESAIKLAMDEAAWLGRHYIGTEHLLLGLVGWQESGAVRVLGSLGISADHIRQGVQRLLQLGFLDISIDEARRMARFTEMARRILNGAEYEATSLGYRGVAIEQVLLVLCRDQRNVAGRVMRELGTNVDEWEALLSRASDPSVLDEVFKLAVVIAIRMGDHYTGTDHLLLAIAEHARGAAILAEMGLEPEHVQYRLHELMEEESRK